jgi:thiamine-monophosphate kinase
VLALSGPVGAFGAGLAYFELRARGQAPELPAASVERLRERLVRPVPRVSLGPKLAATAACTAAMDITDGLGQSLRELAEASGVCLEIDADAVPVHPLAESLSASVGLDPYEVAFGIGLDLELLLAVSSADAARELGLIPFGRVSEGSGIRFTRDGTSIEGVPGAGWEHFGGDARHRIARTK